MSKVSLRFIVEVESRGKQDDFGKHFRIRVQTCDMSTREIHENTRLAVSKGYTIDTIKHMVCNIVDRWADGSGRGVTDEV